MSEPECGESFEMEILGGIATYTCRRDPGHEGEHSGFNESLYDAFVAHPRAIAREIIKGLNEEPADD